MTPNCDGHLNDTASGKSHDKFTVMEIGNTMAALLHTFTRFKRFAEVYKLWFEIYGGMRFHTELELWEYIFL